MTQETFLGGLRIARGAGWRAPEDVAERVERRRAVAGLDLFSHEA
jgi:hypothetical protein